MLSLRYCFSLVIYFIVLFNVLINLAALFYVIVEMSNITLPFLFVSNRKILNVSRELQRVVFSGSGQHLQKFKRIIFGLCGRHVTTNWPATRPSELWHSVTKRLFAFSVSVTIVVVFSLALFTCLFSMTTFYAVVKSAYFPILYSGAF